MEPPQAAAPFPYKSEYDLQYVEKPLHLCPVPGLPPKDPSAVTGHVHFLYAGPSLSDPNSYRPATVRLPSQLSPGDLTRVLHASSSSASPTAGATASAKKGKASRKPPGATGPVDHSGTTTSHASTDNSPGV
eukprot:RCo055251